MIAVTPLLHEIIPHGSTRMALLEPDATMGSTYAEQPGTGPPYCERMWRFMDDPSSPMSLWMPAFRANAIGWTLPVQGRGWLEREWYREMEAPFDSCWILDAMIGEACRSFALVTLARPRGSPALSMWAMCCDSIGCVPGSHTRFVRNHPVTLVRGTRHHLATRGYQ